MKKNLFMAILAAAIWGGVPSVYAEEAICLDCHVPAEDWEGLGQEEILAAAKDPTIRHHKDNMEISAEELSSIVTTLLAE